MMKRFKEKTRSIAIIVMVLILSVSVRDMFSATEQKINNDVQSFNIEESNVRITEPGAYYVYGNKNETTNNIVIDVDGEVELTIEDVNVLCESFVSPILVENGTLKLVIKGENVLEASWGAAGISVGENKLIVEGDGFLSVTAHNESGISAQEIIINSGNIEVYADGYGEAVIGTGSKLKLSSITINGGNITAYGNIGEAYGTGTRYASVGIGSAASNCGTITINGGVIKSYCGDGPAIGGEENIKSIKITGGDIIAYGGDCSAGIGCGGAVWSDKGPTSKIDNITITGGNIVAKGGSFGNCWQGAGIGGGRYAQVGTIQITGGVIKAEGSEHSAGIGTGMNGTCDKIQISGGTIEAIAGTYSAAIGLGSYNCVSGYGVEIDSYLNQLLIEGGHITARAQAYASVCLGVDETCDGILNSFVITGGTIVCDSGEYWNDIACDGAEKIVVKGGSISAKNIKHLMVDENGNELHKYEIFVGKNKKDAVVTAINLPGYGIKDVAVDENGYVTLYLPKDKFVKICVDNAWYIIPKQKENAQGWVKEDGVWYYYVDGIAQTGWLLNGGNWFYLKEDCSMATGWVQAGGTWYFMDANGVMKTGWMQQNGNWYYFNGNGSMKTGWMQQSEKWYYFNQNGSMATGLKCVDNVYYYFSTYGAMATGWQNNNGKWYYFNPNGSMKTGWMQQNGTWYYLGEDGVMETGWQSNSGKWYYFNPNGSMATGWVDRNGTWYYFYSNGAMAADTWIGDYYVNASGAWVR